MSAPQPVLLEVVRECHFQQKPCALCGKAKGHSNHTPKKTASCPGRWPRGCNRCGAKKGDRTHYGAPASFNVLASGTGSGNAHVYAGMKDAWQRIFSELLADGGMEPVERVYVEGEITFPDHNENRDQGNFRVVIEKALGDALEQGGYIKRDDWSRYEFGQLSMRVSPGESATRLTIFPGLPAAARPELPRTGEQLEMR